MSMFICIAQKICRIPLSGACLDVVLFEQFMALHRTDPFQTIFRPQKKSEVGFLFLFVKISNHVCLRLTN